jgi:hypothetical protein
MAPKALSIYCIIYDCKPSTGLDRIQNDKAFVSSKWSRTPSYMFVLQIGNIVWFSHIRSISVQDILESLAGLSWLEELMEYIDRNGI